MKKIAGVFKPFVYEDEEKEEGGDCNEYQHHAGILSIQFVAWLAAVVYMDDFYLIHQDKKHLKNCLVQIEKIISDLNLSLNGKTQIMPFKQGIKFLGFHTYISNGKVLCRIRNENKRNAYRKYKKMAHLVVQGKIELTKFNECYQSWKAHAAFGDCEGIISNLDKQINEILGVKLNDK